jgi:chemotaxis protein methyltransferase CheR
MVVEAMTTNETFFFRDKTPFDHFRDTVLPALAGRARGPRTIRIWCAALDRPGALFARHVR